jgi:flagellar hook assembly protein FlgD
VAFSLSSREHVTLAVYSVSGRCVAVLIDSEVDPGVSSVRWDGRDSEGIDVSSGIYFARMIVGGELFERKMTLVR